MMAKDTNHVYSWVYARAAGKLDAPDHFVVGACSCGRWTSRATTKDQAEKSWRDHVAGKVT
jgi:hypothetical protein